MLNKIYNWIESIREKRFYKSLNNLEHKVMQTELDLRKIEKDCEELEYEMLSDQWNKFVSFIDYQYICVN